MPIADGEIELKYLPKVSQLQGGEPGLHPRSLALERVCLTAIVNGHFVVLWDKPSPRSKRFDFRESATRDQAKRGTARSRKKKEVT